MDRRSIDKLHALTAGIEVLEGRAGVGGSHRRISLGRDIFGSLQDNSSIVEAFFYLKEND